MMPERPDMSPGYRMIELRPLPEEQRVAKGIWIGKLTMIQEAVVKPSHPTSGGPGQPLHQ